MRCVPWSVKVMASSVVTDDCGLTLVLVMTAGSAAFQVRRLLLVPDPNTAAFAAGSKPMDGSPPLMPTS